MDSTDRNTEQNIRTFIEDLLNEIIATAIETARKENTAIEEDTVRGECSHTHAQIARRSTRHCAPTGCGGCRRRREDACHCLACVWSHSSLTKVNDNPPQRMDQPPQYPQQSMHMKRAGLPQVMPQMQVNNNIQYMAAGPPRTPTISSYYQSYQSKLPPNQQMRKRMDQPPQYPPQSMHMKRAGLPQVMPQMQVNNNIQYMAAGPSRTPTISSYQSKLPPNQQMRKIMDQPPQYPQQSMHMKRAGLPQVMPQMRVNNNMQYMAAGPSRTPTIRSYQSKLPPNQQMRKRMYRPSQKVKSIDVIDLTLSDEETPTKKDKQENEAQVQPQQAVSNSKQRTTPSITTIKKDSPSLSSLTPTTEAS